MNYLEWKTERRKINQLVPLEKNPFGIITEEKKQRLEDKIRRLGVFEIPTIDTNNDLLTFNKRRHILMILGRGEEEIDVRVPNRALTKKERDEIIVSSNIHEGEWDRQVLESEFFSVDLEALGLDLAAIPMPEDMAAHIHIGEDVEEVSEEEAAKFPIEARFSEKYDAFVIISDNEVDANYIQEVLGLEVTKSYKSSAIGRTRVIPGHKFMKLIRDLKNKPDGNSQ
jgi:hypothetical protein